jgi:hypothetical protein
LTSISSAGSAAIGRDECLTGNGAFGVYQATARTVPSAVRFNSVQAVCLIGPYRHADPYKTCDTPVPSRNALQPP